VAFIARTAAKRRAKHNAGRVVIHPVAIKYLFLGDIQEWGNAAVSRLEQGLGWRPTPDEPLLDRIRRLAEAMLSIHEVRYLGKTTHHALPIRRDNLVQHLLAEAESEFQLTSDPNLGPLGRVRRLRSTLTVELTKCDNDARRRHLYHTTDAVELCQQLYSYPDRYLFQYPTTDTQILETLERMQEGLFGKADHPAPLKAIIEFDEAIEVPTDRPPKGEPDPLMQAIGSSLTKMLQRLAIEANRVELPHPAGQAGPID
jgi:hypothetical protein